jgi:type II secretory pathway component PulF
MFFRKKFFDSSWNFDNTKFLELAEKARKALRNKNKKWWLNKNMEITLFKSVSKKEVRQFINKFSIFVNSWLDIKWALMILTKQTKNVYFKGIIKEMRINIDYGISISETMIQYPKVFDNLIVSLISIWEKSWKLWDILGKLDTTLRDSLELKWKIKWAMIYPTALLWLTIIMVTVMMIFIVPKVSESFENTWHALPWLTQKVVSVSRWLGWLTETKKLVLWDDITKFPKDKKNQKPILKPLDEEWKRSLKWWEVCVIDKGFLVPKPDAEEDPVTWKIRKEDLTRWSEPFYWKIVITDKKKWFFGNLISSITGSKPIRPEYSCQVSWNWWKALLYVILFVFIVKLFYKKTETWKTTIWWLATNLPVFWKMIRQANIVYFIQSFTILLNSWVLLLESLKLSSMVVPNILYKREIMRIKNEVETGFSISKAIWLNLEYEASVYLNKLFPEDFAYIVNTWEETWTLVQSLERVWDNYNRELKRYVANMSSMMEPFIIVLVWALVWIIVVAIMLPFFKMWEVAKDL